MSAYRQIALILSLAIILGLARSLFLNDEFQLIKKKIQIDLNVPNTPTEINLERAKELYFEPDAAIFLDARDIEDYDRGHIKGAINIPYESYDEIESLDSEKLYITYCDGGENCSLSEDLAGELHYNEFEKIYIFIDGWESWQKANLPFTSMIDNKNESQSVNPEKYIFWTACILTLFIFFHFLIIKYNLSLFKLDKLDITFVPRLFIGIIFIYASYEKILDPAIFSKSINNFHLTENIIWVENLIALILPWLELIIGVFLVFGLFLEGTTSIIIVLLIFFIAILSQAVFRGIDVHCGCFKLEADVGTTDFRMELIKRIGEDIIYLGLAFAVKFKEKLLLQSKD